MYSVTRPPLPLLSEEPEDPMSMRSLSKATDRPKWLPAYPSDHESVNEPFDSVVLIEPHSAAAAIVVR